MNARLRRLRRRCGHHRFTVDRVQPAVVVPNGTGPPMPQRRSCRRRRRPGDDRQRVVESARVAAGRRSRAS